MPSGLTADITKAVSNIDITGLVLSGQYGQTLATINQETDRYHLIWDVPTTTLTKTGEQELHSATLVPKDTNYQNQTVTVAIDVSKAGAPELTDIDYRFKVPANRVVTTTLSAIDIGLPDDSGEVRYSIETLSDSAAILSNPVINGGYLTYQLLAETAGKQAQLLLDVMTDNYQTAHFKLNLITEAKDVPQLSVSNLTKQYDKVAITADDIEKQAIFSGQTVAGTWQFSPNLATIKAAGHHTVHAVFIPEESDNYSQAQVNFSIVIAKKALRITGVSAKDRAYAKNEIKVDLSGGQLIGVITGDDVAIDLGNGTAFSAIVSDDTVEQAKPVVTALRLTGADATNYTFEQPTGITVDIFEDNTVEDSDVTADDDTTPSDDTASDDTTDDTTTPDDAASDNTTDDTTPSDNAVSDETIPDDTIVDNSQAQPEQQMKLQETAQFDVPIQSEAADEEAIISQEVQLNKGVAQLMIEKTEESAVAKLAIKPKSGYRVSDVTLYDEAGETVEYIIDEEGLLNILVPKGNLSVDVKFNFVLPQVATFSDVPLSKPYALAVEYLASQNIIEGMTETTFAPMALIERASFIKMLYEMSGVRHDDNQLEFNDAYSEEWYYQALCWGAKAGIAKGYSSTTFAPLKVVNREELLAFLYRYQMLSKTVENTTIDLTAYQDGASVSDYAKPAYKWALDNQIIMPNESGLLLPQANVSRAEAAEIIYRYLAR